MGKREEEEGNLFEGSPAAGCHRSSRKRGGEEIRGSVVLVVAMVRVVGEGAERQRDDGSTVLHAAAQLQRGEAEQVFHGL